MQQIVATKTPPNPELKGKAYDSIELAYWSSLSSVSFEGLLDRASSQLVGSPPYSKSGSRCIPHLLA